MVKFHNATDSEGNIIKISDVKKEHRAKQYYCIGCGKEMSAVLGEKREHHFRHKEAACSWESYLHKLGKKFLKERFYTQKDFKISYYVDSVCNKAQGCELETIYDKQKCNRRELLYTNLKELYDTCEEVTYRGYRADLMLSHSEHPEREPIFIEVSVTHDCEQKKIESGIKIIELKITDEKDFQSPLEERSSLFLDAESKNPYSCCNLPSVRFYNFQRRFTTERPLQRFWISLNQNRILYGNCIQDNLTCQTVETNHREDSIFEVAIPSEVFINNQRCNPLEFGMVRAFKKNIDIKHCYFCSYYSNCICTLNFEQINKNDGKTHMVTRNVIISQLTDENIDKYAYASLCKKYRRNTYLIYQIERYYQRLPYWEWKRE